MLSVNNSKLIILARHPAWKGYADNTFCHLRTYRDNYKHLVQSLSYSTKCSAKHNVRDSPLDPRVEALREKLIYCDYLDCNKAKTGYLKRLLTKKRFEFAKRREHMHKLASVPVYSIFLDAKNNENDLQADPDEEHTYPEDNVTRPIHMPYASTDRYSNVDISKDNIDTSNNLATNDFDENTIPLNEKYKILYNKYLAAKSAALSRGEELTLEEYLEGMDIAKTESSSSSVPSNWMADYEQYDDALRDNTWLDNYGTPDPNSSISPVPCGGCGALLHCKDHAIPGYLPSEIFSKKTDQDLRVMICQRCHFIKYYNTMLEVKVSAEEYPQLLKVIKRKKCAVILMVDLTDFPCSIWPEINSVLHPKTSVFVVGNKVDLLPQDSRHFITHVKECLSQAVENTGINKECIKHIELISAKTSYGIEELINKLHSLWKYKGDVYVIGCTNVGKSSLFNALLKSDYCKVQAVDLIQRATTSPWPGTTLNLLKFPILNPIKWRLYWRMMRLRSEQLQKQVEKRFRIEQLQSSRNLKYATLQSRIGRTFLPSKTDEKNAIKDQFVEEKYKKRAMKFGLDETEEIYKYSRWCYDTPGTIQPDQVLDLLTTEELLSVLPKQIISPRTFILHANQTIFLAGIGRLDYLEGDHFIRCTIFSSSELPVTLTRTADADDIYKELIKTKAFVVPENNPDRLKYWPALGSKEMEVTGIGDNESVADVVLSSAGWVAITGKENERILLRAWSPQGRGLHLRMPALLKKSVSLRGHRIPDAPTYMRGRQTYQK